MNLTRTAYGIWNGGRFMHFGQALEEDRFIAAIRVAYERGIRTFITADVYGCGQADQMLGRALDGLPRESYCLVGAVGHDFYEGKRDGAKGFPRFTDGRLRKSDQYASYLRMATERSLARLGADKFDLVLLHNPDYTGYSSDKVWDGMQKLKETGLSERLGIAPGPANGFSLDIILNFERFGALVDWAMVILNPLEPWPGNLCLGAAEKHNVSVLTRVVDHGGLFHDDVKPGHKFGQSDHRCFRPAGWLEAGNAKIDQMREIASKHGLTLLQLACIWNLSHPSVESVVPTLIQECSGKSIETKIDELALVGTDTRLATLKLSDQELETITRIGNNKGCMALKGGNPEHTGEPVADRWPVNEELRSVGQRWAITPETDLICVH